jgi:DNA-binding NarL/FixJ family response regulator
MRTGADAAITLREAASAAAEAAERARSVAELLDEALAELQRVDPALSTAPARSRRFPRRSGRLSVREREVLSLVAEGQTNKAIASLLYVSPNTVKTHVASLLNKLQADSRAELAAIAIRLELNERVPSRRAELAS